MGEIETLTAALSGRYEIEREVGRGGMATVYLARDLKHNRKVALKVLRPELGAVLGVERFLTEIKVTAGLQHPNILPLFDSGAADGLLFYVMPYVRGETLRDRLTRERLLPVDEAVAIARGIASALEHAHQQDVVHRDIKPENVLLSDGVPMVADFGIARALNSASGSRATQAGISMGTPAYMSPEQAMGDADVDRRSDLYSLGCVLFEMLAGDAPFTGATAAAVVSQHVIAPVPSVRNLRTTVPPTIESVITRALAKDRDERFPTAAEMSAALAAPPPVEPMPDYSKVAEPITRTTAPLAGRRKERAAIIARLDALAEGRGALVLVGGEPGVGKTRLVEDVLLEARSRGYLCSVGHCYETEGSPPYLPFIEQMEYLTRNVPPGRLRAVLGSGAAELARIMPRLRQLFPDIPEPLDLPPDQQRHFLFTQYREFIERGARNVPQVYHFDDLHWADDSTLLLLEHIAPHLAQLPILLLGTYRDVELDVARPFARTLERLARQRLTERIALRRMPEDDIAALLAQLGGPEPPKALVRALFAETEGNPFFVEELFRHLRDEGRILDAEGRWIQGLNIEGLEVPEGVRLVIGRRLERVSDDCRAVLTAAAVIGARFDLAVLEALGDVGAEAMLDALEEAERAGLVIAQQVKRDTRYTFAHELIRQTLVSSLSMPRRLRRHLRTAEAIEKAYAGKLAQHVTELAYHLFQSGPGADEEKATRYLLLAGEQALSAGAFDEALGQVDKAFSILETADQRRKADLLSVQAAALRGLGQWSDATRVFLEACELFEAVGAERELLRTTYMLAEMLYWLDQTKLLAVTERALAATADTANADRARLLAMLGTALALGGRYADAVAASDRALEMATSLADADARGYALSQRSALLCQYARLTDAMQAAEGALAVLTQTGKRWETLWAGSRLLFSTAYQRPPHETLAFGLELAREATAIGHRGVLTATQLFIATGRCMLDDHISVLDAAAAELRRDLGDLGDQSGWGAIFAAFAALERDETASGDLFAILEETAERFSFESFRGTFRAEHFCLVAIVDPMRARTMLDSDAAAVPVVGRPSFIGVWLGIPFLIEGLLHIDDHRRAAALYPVCLEMMDMGMQFGVGGLVDRMAAVAAAAGAQWDIAERHFERAFVLAHELPHVPEQAGVRYWYAWMLAARRATGDVARARALLDEALPMFERAGRTRRVRESRELLAELAGIS